MKACGIGFVLFVMLLMLFQYGMIVGSNFWLSVWSEESTEFYTKLKAYNALGNMTNMTVPVSYEN